MKQARRSIRGRWFAWLFAAVHVACGDDTVPTAAGALSICDRPHWVDKIPTSNPQSSGFNVALASGPTGDLYVGGGFGSSAAFPGGAVLNHPVGSGYVARVSSESGKVVWAKSTSGEGEIVIAIAANNRGTVAYLTLGGPALGAKTTVLSGRLTADGTLQFETPIPLEGQGFPLPGYRVAASPADGGFAVCGFREGLPSSRSFLAKYDPTGEMLWQASEPSESSELGCGDVAFDGAGDLLQVAQSAEEAAVVKFDGSTGMRMWRSALPKGPLGAVTARAIAVDPRDDILLAGTQTRGYTAGNPPSTYPAGREVVVAKLSRNGESLWSRAFTQLFPTSALTELPGRIPAAHDIAIDARGNAFVVGGAQVTDRVGVGTSGKTKMIDVFLLEVDGLDGAQRCATFLGGKGEQAGYAISTRHRENGAFGITLAGAFKGELMLAGGFTLRHAGEDWMTFLAHWR